MSFGLSDIYDCDYEDTKMYMQQKSIEDKIIENERNKEDATTI